MHPLVQVYTIPRTSQLAYVGHVCNFRQKVTQFLSRLPARPGNMPFVKVRSRSYCGQPSRKAPFIVNVQTGHWNLILHSVILAPRIPESNFEPELILADWSGVPDPAGLNLVL